MAVNDSMCRQLGYTREEMLRLTIYDIDPTAPQPWAGFWQRCSTSEGQRTFETVHATKDGHLVPVEVTTNYLEHDGKGYNSSSRPTSSPQEDGGAAPAHPALDRPGARPDLLDHAAGAFVYASDSTCQQLGYTREELMQLTIFDIDPSLPRDWRRSGTSSSGTAPWCTRLSTSQGRGGDPGGGPRQLRGARRRRVQLRLRQRHPRPQAHGGATAPDPALREPRRRPDLLDQPRGQDRVRQRIHVQAARATPAKS